MDYSKLSELVKNEKKSSASKAIKEDFENEMISLFKEEGFSPVSEKYLYSGLAYCGAKPLFDYFLILDEEERKELINKVFTSTIFKSNERGCSFKLCVSFLCETINRSPDEKHLLALLIQRIPDLAYKKNGDLFPDAVSTIERYLIQDLDAESISSIKFNDLELSDFAKKQFRELVSTLIESIDGLKKKTIPKKESFLQWIKDSEGVVNDDNEDNKENAPVATAMLLRKLGAQVINISEQIDKKEYLYLKQLEEKNQIISALESSIHMKNSTMLDLNNQINDLKSEVLLLTKKLESTNSKADNLENEILRMQSVISVYSTDKLDSQTEQLNAIASKLKAEYNDYLDAKGMEMSIELGENLKYQIEEIFNILEKSGIKVKGR